MDKEDVIYIYIYVYIHTQWNIAQPIKKNDIMPFSVTWMDLKITMLSELNR